MMRPRLVVLCALLPVALELGACGRDPAQVRWDDAFTAAVRRGTEHPDEAVEALLALAAKAPRAVDQGAARLEAVRLLEAQGKTLEAAELLQAIARDAPRQDDRARAYYELGRLAEDRGDLPAAQSIYRALVRTYPELMPGERALAHLFRIARAEGPAAVDAHLEWTRSLTELLAGTALADNILYQAADEAKRRAEASQRPADWTLTETLYRRIADEMPEAGLWNDALWELSWIYHRQGRFPEEIKVIERILRTRQQISLFGQDEHPYYWQGQLRIARLQLVELAQPARAIDSYLRYAELFPKTIKKDDVRFFALCAALQAGQRARADELRALLQKEHPDSKYLRRLEPAFADPHGPHCLPPAVEP